MFELIFAGILFIFPAYFANMCPVLFGKMKFPFGKSINERLFGKNKTWRGIYAGYIGALLMLFLERYLQGEGVFEAYWMFDFSEINLFLYAFLFGVGAIMGDLIESFFKRRLNIAPGKPFFPFDQVDFVFGAYLFLFPMYIFDWRFFILEWRVLIAVLGVTPFLHFLTNVIAYFFGLKKVWW